MIFPEQTSTAFPLDEHNEPKTISNPYVIDEIRKGTKDITIILVASVHGNEIEGMKVIKRVFSDLHNHCPIDNIHIIGICASPEAQKAKKRFIDEDLNRLWNNQIFQYIHTIAPQKRNVEQRIILKLYAMMKFVIESAPNHVYLIDLHTFSSNGDAFIMGQLENDMAAYLNKVCHIPMVLNERDYIKNTIVGYWSRKKINAIIIEGGKKGTKKAINNIYYILCRALKGIAKKYIPPPIKLISDYSMDDRFPIQYSICYRYNAPSNHLFKMASDYINFQKINEGEVLATEAGKPIYSALNGHILFPLYQKKGDDGFFIVKRVRA